MSTRCWRRTMPLRPLLVVLVALSFVPLFASSKPKSLPNQSIDQIVANERALGNTIRNYSPMVETYLQRMQPDNTLGFIPSEDHYFLGRIRCLLFEVSPKKERPDRFRGAIWVEDESYSIVRFNGSYGTFHIDSWRLNLGPGVWLPSVVYSEEFDSTKPQTRGPRLKAQTRLWGYNYTSSHSSEFSEISVDPDAAKDSTESPDKRPLDIQRSWQRRAEDNVIIKLEELGLIAPEGEVDKVVQTVVTNLEVTNKIVL